MRSQASCRGRACPARSETGQFNLNDGDGIPASVPRASEQFRVTRCVSVTKQANVSGASVEVVTHAVEQGYGAVPVGILVFELPH